MTCKFKATFLFCILMLFFVNTIPTLHAETIQYLTLPQSLQSSPIQIIPLSRDPFNWSAQQRTRLRQALEAEENPFADINLQAILWTPSSPQAMINKKLIHEGDIVNGVTVIAIGRNSITLRKNDKKHTLLFPRPNIDFGYPPNTTTKDVSQEQANENN